MVSLTTRCLSTAHLEVSVQFLSSGLYQALGHLGLRYMATNVLQRIVLRFSVNVCEACPSVLSEDGDQPLLRLRMLFFIKIAKTFRNRQLKRVVTFQHFLTRYESRSNASQQ